MYKRQVYDTTVYDVYAFVLRNETGSLYVKSIICTKPVKNDRDEIKDTKADLIFTNDYGKDDDTTHDINIIKKVTGNMGETNKDFVFRVKVKGTAGEWYKVVDVYKRQSLPRIRSTCSYMMSSRNQPT